MAITEFVAAIEISSTMLYGLAGKKGEDGSLSVLAFAETSAISFVNKGTIFNIDKAILAIKSIVEQLEIQLDSKISQVFLGVNAQSIRTDKNSVIEKFEGKQKINQEIIKKVEKQNADSIIKLGKYSLLKIVPQEYKIGTIKKTNPEGILTEEPLEGNFVNIIGKPTILENIEQCFKKAESDSTPSLNFENAGILLSHLTSAKLFLRESQMNSGCAFVNFGAETTALSIYKNNILRYFVVIPLGGNSLTKDLSTALKVDMERAELLKQAYGNLNYKEDNLKDPQTLYIDTNKTSEVSQLIFNSVLYARQEEIVKNIWNRIQLSGFEHELNEGIIYTGGASKLTGFNDFFISCIKFKNIQEGHILDHKIEYSNIVSSSIAGHSKDRLATPLSLLFFADKNCVAKVENMLNETRDLFEIDRLTLKQRDASDEIKEKQQKAKEEAERKARELELEKERKQAEEIKKEKELERERLEDLERQEKERKKIAKKKKSFFTSLADKFNKTISDLADSTFSDSDNDNK